MGHPEVLPGEVARGWVPTGGARPQAPLTAGPGVGQPGPGAPPCAPSTQVPPTVVVVVFAFLIYMLIGMGKAAFWGVIWGADGRGAAPRSVGGGSGLSKAEVGYLTLSRL